MNITTLIAWRYLRHKEKDSNISFMLKICFIGIALGTFALMLTLIITNGFEKVIHEKMRGINAPIVIYHPGSKLDYANLANALRTEFTPQIRGVSANTFRQAIIDDNDMQTVIVLKGIDPATDATVTTLPSKIINPKVTGDRQQVLPTLLQPDHILIGYKLAKDRNLHVGQEMSLLIPEPKSKKKLALHKHTVTIAGIVNIGLEEYDNNMAFIALDSLNEMFDERGVEQIIVSLKDDPAEHYTPTTLWTSWDGMKEQTTFWWHKIRRLFIAHDHEQEVIRLLRKRLPHLTVASWQEQYPALVSSLKLEKYVMFFILALITLVACMNMISLLFMQIQQKRRDIAIFKAMGMYDQQIRAIFLRMGLTITLSASLFGLGLAALAGYLLERYPFIELPDVYYVSYLPARMDAEIFMVVFAATLLIGFFATWLPARRVTRINVSNVLRQD
jgi:lipoprotein-releasing system permease protein